MSVNMGPTGNIPCNTPDPVKLHAQCWCICTEFHKQGTNSPMPVLAYSILTRAMFSRLGKMWDNPSLGTQIIHCLPMWTYRANPTLLPAVHMQQHRWHTSAFEKLNHWPLILLALITRWYGISKLPCNVVSTSKSPSQHYCSTEVSPGMFNESYVQPCHQNCHISARNGFQFHSESLHSM
jgi:hypothetical protein